MASLDCSDTIYNNPKEEEEEEKEREIDDEEEEESYPYTRYYSKKN
jgi:hypothetical protein